MKFAIRKINITPINLVRRCGYVEIYNPHKNNEVSYARSLDSGRFYPRFHIYIEEQAEKIVLNLHLDAKKPSYEGETAHSGEYDGPLLNEERERIDRVTEKFVPQQIPANQKLGFQNKKSFWQKILKIFRK